MFFRILLYLIAGLLCLLVAFFAGVTLRDLWRGTRFLWSVRRLAPKEDEEDFFRESPSKKLTPEELEERERALWTQLYRPGLSRARLGALQQLLAQPDRLFLQDWLWRLWWRGWQRLAVEAPDPLRGEATQIARIEGKRYLHRLASADLDLLLPLLPRRDAATRELDWIRGRLQHFLSRPEARRRLEALAQRGDLTGATALCRLIDHHIERKDQEAAIPDARAPPGRAPGSRSFAQENALRKLLEPRLFHVPVAGLHIVWSFHSSGLQFRLSAVRFEPTRENAVAWLAAPPDPSRGEDGEEQLRGELPTIALPFGVHLAAIRLPPALRGVFALTITARPAPPALLARRLPEVQPPEATLREHLQQTRLDAVLGLTETGASLWVVDRDTRRPAPGLPVTFWLKSGPAAPPEALRCTTDREGLATVELGKAWQLGASVHRFNPRGAEEFLFLTHGEDIQTTIPAKQQERLYVWLARPLYRPGETVQGKLLGRLKGADAPSTRLSQGRRIGLQVRGPQNAVLTELSLSLSRFGGASFSFTIPAGTVLGKYTFRLHHPDATLLEGSFQVEEFVAPEFKATLRSEAPPRWAQETPLLFEASYFFGGPVKDAEGLLEISRQNWTHWPTGQGQPLRIQDEARTLDPISFRTDGAGRARILLPRLTPFDPLRRKDGFDLHLKATLRDASGKTCEAPLTLSFGRCPHAVAITPEDRLRLPGEPISLGLRWFPEEREVSEYDLELTLKKGLERQRHQLRVSTQDRSVRLPQGVAPGLWKLTARLRGQRRLTQHEQAIWILGDQIETGAPQLLLSREKIAHDGLVRLAFVGPRGPAPLSVLLLLNRGPTLVARVLSSPASAAWLELPVPPGQGSRVHVSAWFVRPEKASFLQQWNAHFEVEEPPSPAPPQLPLHLDFPASTAPPGSTVHLTSALLEKIDGPGELVCSVVDEALFSIVPAPPSPLDFFEKSPPRPLHKPAPSMRWEQAQHGRYAHPPSPWDDAGVLSSRLASPEGKLQSMPRFSLGAPAPMMGGAPGISAPMAAAPAAAPAAPSPVFDEQEMAAPRSRGMFKAKRAEAAGSSDEPAPNEPEFQVDDAPVALRSDFSSEAAWSPETLIDNASDAVLAVKLPDTLTTWKAAALVLTLDDRMGEAEARIQTRKPLMIRLQMPRFFQERDVFALRALIDNPSEESLQIRARLDAHGLSIQPGSTFSFALPAGGQHRVEAEATVPAKEDREWLIRAEVRSVQGASDAEERRVPHRPYGTLQRITRQGVVQGEQERVTLDLPERRKQGATRLTLRVDRGPLDAVLQALNYLREYPYGCTEQTCSRLIPQLVWERVLAHREEAREGYRDAGKPASPEAVEEPLQRLLSQQNPDGGFGWWSSRPSDLWMTAYLLFSFSLAQRPDATSLQKATRYLREHLLDANNADDADAFAAFVLAWRGEPVEDRVFQVLLPRWDNLSLTEQAKLCLPLRAARHPEAGDRTRSVRRKLVRSARNFLRRIEEETPERGWFEPRATEAIAFFVLVLLHPSSTPDKQAAEPDEEALSLLLSFLLLHRSGTRWHSTRDTALAVLALLSHEERLGERAREIALRLAVNGKDLSPLELGGILGQATQVTLRDDGLRSGSNTLTLSLEGAAADDVLQQRHYTAELEYISQEDTLAARDEGIALERVYWLLDERNQPARRLKSGERVQVGQRLRVALSARSKKPRRYLLLEDPKLAGCEPLAKTSGPDVCSGRCEHVELRADRVAIFVGHLGDEEARLSYDIEAQIPGKFTALPACMEPMYDSGCSGTSASFSLVIEP